MRQTARYAGQILFAIHDNSGCVDLHDLGFMCQGFPSMVAAQAAAPTFACEVLAHMAALIQETKSASGGGGL